MLTITIPGGETFNESTNEFVYTKPKTITLEHSLVSISKWEEKWQKPYLVKGEHTYEESVDYIRCMTITQNVDPNLYYGLSKELFDQIQAYMNSSHTATWFSDEKRRPNGPPRGHRKNEVITSELIYYWMICLNIPFECQKWHINRLLTLIRVCNEKNNPKKMSKNEIRGNNKALNEMRRKSMHTKG